MRCVHYDSKKPDGFEEHFVFSENMPYTLRIKTFPLEDIVPMHYAETIEILLCTHLEGKVVIDNTSYPLMGKQLFVIPPNTVHSNHIFKCGGTEYVLKLCLSELDRYMNLTNILDKQGCQLSQFAHVCPEYDTVRDIFFTIIENDGNLVACLTAILRLIGILVKYADEASSHSRLPLQLNRSDLYKLITWTQENFSRKITLDEVAAKVGYSKHYFCNRFKQLTGITYMAYLNSVRIAHACLLLRNSKPVKDVFPECGFEDESYFIQVFKKAHHVTPLQFAQGHNGAEAANGGTG